MPEYVKFETVASTQKGSIAIGPFGSALKADQYTASGIPVLRGQNLTSNRTIEGSFVFVSEEDALRLGRSLVTEHDLVFPHRGAIGEVGIIPHGRTYLLSSSMMKISIDTSKADAKFLYYYFRSQGRQELENRASTVGTPGIAQPLASLRSIPVPLLPLKTQESIGQILGLLDDKIEANTKLAHTADELASALYLEATQKTDTLEPLVNLVTTQYGITTSATSTGSHKLLRVTDINKKPWIEIEQAPFCEVPPDQIEKYQVEPGDLLVARMADPGKVALVEEGLQPSVFASYLVRLKPMNKDLSFFLFYFLRSRFYRAYSDAVGDGSVQRNMNAKVIVSVDVPLLDAQKLQEFNSKVKVMHGIRNAALSENQRLSELRDYLLPRLMSGKITVREAEEMIA